MDGRRWGHGGESTVGLVRLRPGLVIVCLFVTACSSGSDAAVDTVVASPHEGGGRRGTIPTTLGLHRGPRRDRRRTAVRELRASTGQRRPRGRARRRARCCSRRPIGDEYFGEGLADRPPGRWCSSRGRRAPRSCGSPTTSSPAGKFHVHRAKGWGLTRDGGELVQSDGSDSLICRDPPTSRCAAGAGDRGRQAGRSAQRARGGRFGGLRQRVEDHRHVGDRSVAGHVTETIDASVARAEGPRRSRRRAERDRASAGHRGGPPAAHRQAVAVALRRATGAGMRAWPPRRCC